MFLTHSDETLEIEKFKRSRENKIKFAYDYGNLNASYVNEKINFEDDYFQEIINPDFEKIDSPFQQTSSLKPYVHNVILEKIIIDLEDEVVNLLEKEKVNLETIESLKSKVLKCDKEENPKVIAHGMFKLNVSQCVSPISMSKSSCGSKNVEIKLKRKSHLDTFSSVRRPRHRDVTWKKKGSSNTSNVGLSDVIVSNSNKNVMRYSRKDLLAYEASEVIISFIKKTQVNLQLQVQCVRTDNGMEFKNKTLANFFDEIHESVNVNFDELLEMASKQFNLEPSLSNLNDTGKSSNPSVSNVDEASKKDLEDLFQDFYDEYFDSSKIMKSSTTNVETSINDEVFHESIPINMVPNGDEASTSHNMFNERLKDACFDLRTSFHDPSNVQTFYQPYPHEKKWTKDHPLYKIISDPKSSVRTRGQLANSCLFSCLLSSIEPANVAEALRDADWVSAMQEELDQFVIQIVLGYLDSRCSKHMTRNRSPLMNFVSKFLGTIRLGNDHIARIIGYGDYQLGNVTISRVYYIEGLGHNLFSVGQFCDVYLKVAFRKNTCFIRNLDGVDLKSESRDTNFTQFLLMTCLKHLRSVFYQKRQRLRAGYGIVGKSKKSSHQTKAEDTNHEKLYLLHKDLCGPMRVASINGKRTRALMYDSCNIQFKTRSKPFPDAVAPRAVDLADSPVSMLIDQDAPSTSILSTLEQEHFPIITQGFEESPKTPTFHDDPLNESPHEDSTSQGSTKQAMTEPSWIDAMQEEIHEFEMLQVWELVPCPDKVFLNKLKWIYKSKLDKDLQGKPVDATLYHGMIGSLMYLTSSRPDLTYAVCLCARYQTKPTKKHLEKEKANLETIESLKSKGVESSEKVCSKLENQSENDCLVVEKECDKEENPNVIAPWMFKLNVSQCVSLTSINMNPIASQQDALDNALVSSEKRLKIKRCNARIVFSKPQKEETYQVTLDNLKLSPCYPAFYITSEVPKIYMHQFWNTIKNIGKTDGYNFKLDKKKYRVDTKVFREILQICPRIPNQDFMERPSEEDLLSLIKELAYSSKYDMLSTIRTDQMHQPWRTFDVVINRCISGKSTGLDRLRESLIPGGMINDDIKISKAYKTYLEYATGKVPPKKARKFKQPASPILKIEPASPKEPTQKDKRASGSSDGVDFESEVLDEPTGKTKDINEGTGVKLGVLDVSKDDSFDSNNDSWGDSEDESDDDHDKDDNDDTDDNDNDSAYNSDKDIFTSYGDVVTLKRGRGDQDKDEDPFAGSNRGTKRRKSSKDVEPSKGSKSKESKPSSSSKGTQSQHKSFGKSTQAEEPEFKVKPDKPPTPDRAWNKSKSIDFRPPQKWIITIAKECYKEKQPPRTFDELMGTPIDLSAYVMNRLKIDNMTQEILVGPAFNLLKGTCKSFAEHEYHFEECYKAINDRLDWHNLERHEYAFDLSKPLPLIKDQGRQIVHADYFINNDLKYLKCGSSSSKRATSTTRTKAAKDDNVLYKFKEGVALRMFTRRIVILPRVEYLQLGVESYQKKLNITRPEANIFNISKLTPYASIQKPQGIIYQDKYKRNSLMRSDKLYKFYDMTLSSIRRVLHDIASKLDMDYLPKRHWSNMEMKRSRIMVKVIDKLLFEKRLMRNLEKFVGGRDYKNDLRLLDRTI
nr:integrase, catalytic region, zinc finger, CCHC-type, peptidase aspartic, catalytic [Tanacetum cinerariifolium]